jgi:hypothetical protein
MRDPDMSKASAIALYESGWWKLYPARDVALAQLGQARLCMPYDDYRRIVEDVIGGPVYTHEFARPLNIIARIEAGQRGGVDPMRSLAAVILRRTRSGMWATKGRRYRTKALAMASRTIAVML